MKFVSIIIPVYNAKPYLEDCLRTAVSQSYPELEIILVDDGSTDGSGTECDEIAATDARCRVFHQENKGVSAARNLGISMARGDYLFFMDADDTMDRDTIEVLMGCAGSEWIIGDFKLIRAARNVRGNNFFFDQDKNFRGAEIPGLVTGYLKKPRGASEFTNVWGKLYKTAVIKENHIRFREELKTWEDIVFNFAYVKSINSIDYVRRQCYDYHVHPKLCSAGAQVLYFPLGFITVLDEAADYLRARRVSEDEINRNYGRAAVYFAVRILLLSFGLWERGKCAPDIDRCKMRSLIDEIIGNAAVGKGLKTYRAGKGESRLLPVLMKYKWSSLIFLECCRKTNKILRNEKS